MVHTITSKSDFDSLIAGSKLVLVDYWATWCGPCKVLSPVFNEAEWKYKDIIIFAKLDIEQVPGIAESQGIRTIPTLVAYKNGRPIETRAGVTGSRLDEWIDNLIVHAH